MMKRILLVILMLCLVGGLAQAQNTNGPLIVLMNGDLWSWDGAANSALKQLTTFGFQQEMSLSPDGKQVAYTSYPQIVADFIHREGGLGGGALPTNIWLMDIASGNAARIADQPSDASFFVQGVPDKVIVRSKPAWSPDSTKMAWTEYDFTNDQAQRIVVYDLATGQSKTIVNDLPAQYGVPTPIEIHWNQVGIVVVSFTPDSAGSSGYDEKFLTYTPDGTLIKTIVATVGDTLNNWLLVTANGQDALAVQSSDGSWKLFDLTTGASQDIADVPQPYSLLAPDAQPVVHVMNSPDGKMYLLQPLDAQGNPSGEPANAGYDLDHIAISPDGRAAAFLPYNTTTQVYDQQIEIWRDGQLTTMPPSGDSAYISQFVWGPTAWRVSDTLQLGTPTQAAFDCPGALPPRLSIGVQGRVIPGGGPNNLRDSTDLKSPVTGQLPEGSLFIVTDGPMCSNGMIWWWVNYNGQQGWTAEGQNGTYYLEPAP